MPLGVVGQVQRVRVVDSLFFVCEVGSTAGSLDLPNRRCICKSEWLAGVFPEGALWGASVLVHKYLLVKLSQSDIRICVGESLQCI